MDSTDFKFFKVWNEKMALTPNGYRLATLEEVRNRNNYDFIRRGPLKVPLGLKEPIGPKKPKEQKMCLLDGYITYPYKKFFDTEEVFAECEWRLVVKDSSANRSSESDVLRQHLYDDITVSPQGTEIAFLNAIRHGDTEVIYWVLKASPIERRRLKLVVMENNEELLVNASSFYVHMVESLVSSEFLRLPLERGSRNTVVDFAVEYAATSDEIENTIAVAELLIERYSPDIVDKKIFYTEINRTHTSTNTIEEETEPKLNILAPIVLAHVETMPLFRGLENKSIDNIMFKRAYEKSYLDKAAAKAQTEEKCIPMLTKLLSTLPDILENHINKIRPLFVKVFMEANTRGYAIVEKMLQFKECVKEMGTDLFVQCLGMAISKYGFDYVEKLLKVWSSVVGSEPGELGGEVDTDGKTLFHYAAQMGIVDVFKLVSDGRIDKTNLERRDIFGRSILHFASLHGKSDFCRNCIEKLNLNVEDIDSSGQNSLHFAVKGNKGDDVVHDLISSSLSPVKLIHSQDYRGRTSLHLASAKGSLEMIGKLLSPLENDSSRIKEYIQQTDLSLKTALHVASGRGDKKIVRLLLKNGSDPLKERDIHGKTSLHYAALGKDGNAAQGVCELLLRKFEDSPDKKSLLLLAPATGFGTADEGERVQPAVREFLVNEREKATKDRNLRQQIPGEETETATKDQDLLRLAAINEDLEMVLELLDNGANIECLYDERWQNELREAELRPVKSVINQVKAMEGHGRDQPTMEDTLGREPFADGIAALFLDRFIKSPITVGIIGQWGMGKSSVMMQTEKNLLFTAAQLVFPNVFSVKKATEVGKIVLTEKGRKVYEKVQRLKNLVPAVTDKKGKSHVNLLKEYSTQYGDVYKSLACVDTQEMLSYDSQNRLSDVFSEIPRILTIQYNAWNYRNEVEAWAGLAVTITEAIEASMTRSQKFSTAWRYSWKRHKLSIWMQVFLPCFLAFVVAVCVSVILLLLIRQGKFKNFKYGSIPLTILATLWVLVQRVVSIVKPVSTQMMGYITSPDHTSRLGYQAQVIDDINFLKQEIGRKPNPFFSFISGDWCCFNFWDNVENTSIPKLKPASGDRLRIITFVDDLDRCEEKVILEVLSAINLVLARCKINVIMGMDMEMIARAIRNNYKYSKDRCVAEKFISKIVQIPLSLPDPTKEEFNNFLGDELGHKPQRTELTTDFDGEDTDDGEQESNTNRENENAPPRDDCTLDILDGSNTLHSDDEKMSHVEFSKRARLVKKTLLSHFSKEEVDTINKLKSFATGSRNLRREWKRFLYYYKLAFNILSRKGKVYSLRKWKEELVAWIFVCWQWQQEMNFLIEHWREYVPETRDSDGNTTNWDHWSGPSLGEIVTTCENKFLESSTAENGDVLELRGSLRGSNSVDVLKLRGSLGQSNATPCLYENNEDSDEEGASRPGWRKLQEALRIQDVSMKGIKFFQQFRFYCKTDHLPWPLTE